MKITLILGQQNCFYDSYIRSCNPQVHPVSPVQKTLAELHGTDAPVLCGCKKQKQPLLVVKGSDRHFLVATEGTKHLHNQACPFYLAPNEESGRRNYTSDVLSETTGQMAVKLAYKLAEERKKPKESTQDNDEYPTETMDLRGILMVLRERKRIQNGEPGLDKMGTKGLLHLLWEMSKNNGWFPATVEGSMSNRNWERSTSFIDEYCQQIVIEGKPVSNVIFVLNAHKKPKDFASFLTPVREWAKTPNAPSLTRFILAMPNFIRKIDDAFHEIVMVGTNERLLVPTEMIDAIRAEYPANFIKSTVRLQKRSIMLAAFTADEQGRLIVKSLALMLCEPTTNLPCRSRTAMDMIFHLRQGFRQFETPLEYESTASLPDFILHDVDGIERFPLYVIETDEDATRVPADAPWIWDARFARKPPPLPKLKQSRADKLAAQS